MKFSSLPENLKSVIWGMLPTTFELGGANMYCKSRIYSESSQEWTGYYCCRMCEGRANLKIFRDAMFWHQSPSVSWKKEHTCKKNASRRDLTVIDYQDLMKNEVTQLAFKELGKSPLECALQIYKKFEEMPNDEGNKTFIEHTHIEHTYIEHTYIYYFLCFCVYVFDS